MSLADNRIEVFREMSLSFLLNVHAKHSEHKNCGFNVLILSVNEPFWLTELRTAVKSFNLQLLSLKASSNIF